MEIDRLVVPLTEPLSERYGGGDQVELRQNCLDAAGRPYPALDSRCAGSPATVGQRRPKSQARPAEYSLRMSRAVVLTWTSSGPS